MRMLSTALLVIGAVALADPRALAFAPRSLTPDLRPLASDLGPLASVQTDKTRIPKKGDAVVVKGCLRGTSVEGAELLIEDKEGEAHEQDQVPVLTYRLQGDKALLKDLKSQHERRIVSVKGILRSELSRSALGTDVGRTRISIGLDPQNGRRPPGADQAVPVLDATSFEGSTVSCGK